MARDAGWKCNYRGEVGSLRFLLRGTEADDCSVSFRQLGDEGDIIVIELVVDGCIIKFIIDLESYEEN
ncbi:Hypothetical protein FKW44_005396 [Caligus rogercresseyi]|uniref:Uncharacterized protein n=1 Tax=Caligus rogercresseyi TaxID=217165 RepID=A0A7T8QRZ8_CALRO|nr:Hypothetical protein FKW44_005396 [Caligus rogercresseyi]